MADSRSMKHIILQDQINFFSTITINSNVNNNKQYTFSYSTLSVESISTFTVDICLFNVFVSVQAVLQKLTAQPLPLYVAVIMKDAVSWRSSYDVSEVDLSCSVEDALNALLDSLEMQLGAVFVSHMLSYVTVARNGLSEVCFCSSFVIRPTLWHSFHCLGNSENAREGQGNLGNFLKVWENDASSRS